MGGLFLAPQTREIGYSVPFLGGMNTVFATVLLGIGSWMEKLILPCMLCNYQHMLARLKVYVCDVSPALNKAAYLKLEVVVMTNRRIGKTAADSMKEDWVHM